MARVLRAAVLVAAVLVVAAPPAGAAPGDLDPTFSDDGWDAVTNFGFTSGNAVTLQPDGKIVVAGTTQSPSGNYHFGVLRYLPNGALDPGFGNGGKVDIGFENGPNDADASAQAVALQPDGKIVVAGTTDISESGNARQAMSDGQNFAAIRLAATGVLDRSFNPGGPSTPDSIANGRFVIDVAGTNVCRAVAVLADGRIVLAGTSDDEYSLVGLKPDGALDFNGFGTGGTYRQVLGPSTNVTEAMTVQDDGKIVLVGKGWPSTDPYPGFASLRFTARGDDDRSVPSGAARRVDAFPGGDATAAGVAVQSDGKIVVGGRAQRDVGGTPVNEFAAVRLNSDWSLDESFGTDGKARIPIGGNAEARALVLNAEGKAVIVGEAGLGAHPKDLVAVQLTTDGRPDPTYGNQPGQPGVLVLDPSGTDESFRDAATQPDGALVTTGLGGDKAVTARLLGSPAPSLTAGDVAIPEGSGGLGTATLRVELDKPSGKPIGVDYATAPGSATAVSDFAPATGRLTFAPGETSKTIDVTVAGDSVVEPDEEFFLNLSTATNATLGDGQARVLLRDDDSLPSGGGGVPLDVLAPSFQRLAVTGAFRAAPSGGSVGPARAPVGGKVAYTLSEAAAVRFTVERPTSGRKVGRRCVKPTKKNRKSRKCTRYTVLKGSFSHAGNPGANSFKFTGRLGKKKLTPGSYRLVAVAADAAANKSAAKRANFRIVRR